MIKYLRTWFLITLGTRIAVTYVPQEKEPQMLVSADSFVNLVVTQKAKELLGMLDLYGHPGNGSEFLIKTQEQLEETIKKGMPICVEGGSFSDEKRIKS